MRKRRRLSRCPHVVEALTQGGKLDLPRRIAGWLDVLNETGRWALLKLITGSLRIGVSARLAKTAVAELGGRKADEVEDVWHGLAPPYLDLFAWMEGREDRPDTTDPAPFRPAMLAHPIDAAKDLAALQPGDFAAEWKWDGIRVQAVRGPDDHRAERSCVCFRAPAKTSPPRSPILPKRSRRCASNRSRWTANY